MIEGSMQHTEQYAESALAGVEGNTMNNIVKLARTDQLISQQTTAVHHHKRSSNQRILNNTIQLVEKLPS